MREVHSYFMLWQCLYFGWIVLEVLIAFLTRTKRGQGAIRDRGTMLWLWITIVNSVTLCEIAKHYFTPIGHHALRNGTASILLIGGLSIRLISVVSLGKAFSANVAIRESQTINTSGVYKFVRHPSYLGLVVIFWAIGLHNGNVVSLACAVIPTTAVLLYRIHVEEAALVTAFGAAYTEYTTRTKRLLPWIY